MDYYKATRPDGTDFYTGTIKYEVGKRTTHPASKRRTKDDPSTYLSVSTVPTDCTGFKWPCRLFLVRGVGRALTATNLPNKRAFLSVDVVEELPAHMVFGPQGEHVVALIERAARLTSDEAKQLSAAGAATWLTARAAARIAARNAARNAARVAGWYTAGNAAADAALALVVRDLIGSSGFSQTHYDSLTGPWRTVIGKVHPDDAGLPEGKVNDE